MNKIIVSCIIAACAALLALSCGQQQAQTVSYTVSHDSLVKRGAYLVTLAGCGDCHTPRVMTPMGPAPDTTRILSGHPAGSQVPPVNQEAIKAGWALFGPEGTAVATPLGVSFSANITSDETGIGNWSFEQFKTAMTRGKYKGMEGNRDLLPPMPWPNYAQMDTLDLRAIFTYLQSTKPVNNLVPMPIMVTPPEDDREHRPTH
jgi:hypothetical protein